MFTFLLLTVCVPAHAEETPVSKGEVLAEEASSFAQSVLKDHFEQNILSRYPDAEISWTSLAADNPDGGAWLVTAVVKPAGELPKPFFFEVKVSNVVTNPELTEKYLPKIAEANKK